MWGEFRAEFFFKLNEDTNITQNNLFRKRGNDFCSFALTALIIVPAMAKS